MNIYRQNILDHYKNPHNHGHLEGKTFRHEGYNPICGDAIVMEVKANSSSIEDVRFAGEGCAISQAAASMLTDEVKGKSFEDVKSMNRDTMLEMLGVELSPARIKCAVLGLKVVQDGIDIYQGEKSLSKTTTE